jgi:hypothetical protein
MSRLVSRQPVPRIPEWPFVANVARIRDVFLMRAVRLSLAALAGFSFAVAFVAAGPRTPRPPQRVLPPTPVAERVSDSGPALASRFEPIRTLPDLLPAKAVPPTVTAYRPTAPARPGTATAPARTSPSAAPAPVVQPVRRRIVPQRTAPVAPRPSKPAPAPQTFDSSGNTFDSSG